MKKILVNQRGVTLIETVAAVAIIAIITVTILGTLLFGQKVIVFTDEKNNDAAQAQDLVDEIMTKLSQKPLEDYSHDLGIVDAERMENNFDSPTTDLTKKYYIKEVYLDGKLIGYNVYVRVYYENGDSQINLTAFAKKRNPGDSV